MTYYWFYGMLITYKCMTLYKKLHYDTKNEPSYFITTLHPTQVATFLFSPSLCYHLLHHLLHTYPPTHLLFQPSLSFVPPPFLSCYYHHWPPMTHTSPSQNSHNTFYLPLAPCLYMPPPLFVSFPQTSSQLQACYHFFGFVHLHEVALGMPIVVSSFLFFVLLFL